MSRRWRSRWRSGATVLAIGTGIVLSACASGGDTGGGHELAGGGDASDEHTAPPSCVGPGFAPTAAVEIAFSSLSATVVDEKGRPVPSLRAQACGVDLCLNGTTDAAGKVAIVKEASLIQPAFKYGDGRTHAKFALPLTNPPIAVNLGEQRTVAFEAPDMGVAFVAGESATSNGVTLDLPGDLGPVKPDPFDFDSPELLGFRAAEVPAGALPAAVDPSLGLEIVVALTPTGAVLCPAATITVENRAAWPGGSAVEFFLHGVEVDEEWAPYGGWAKFADGAVTADGLRVETAPGSGLPLLSVVGLRLAR